LYKAVKLMPFKLRHVGWHEFIATSCKYLIWKTGKKK